MGRGFNAMDKPQPPDSAPPRPKKTGGRKMETGKNGVESNEDYSFRTPRHASPIGSRATHLCSISWYINLGWFRSRLVSGSPSIRCLDFSQDWEREKGPRGARRGVAKALVIACRNPVQIRRSPCKKKPRFHLTWQAE